MQANKKIIKENNKTILIARHNYEIIKQSVAKN